MTSISISKAMNRKAVVDFDEVRINSRGAKLFRGGELMLEIRPEPGVEYVLTAAGSIAGEFTS